MPIFRFTDGKEIVEYEAPREEDAAAALQQEYGARIEDFRRDYNPQDTAKDVSTGEMLLPQSTREGMSVRSLASDIISAPTRGVYGALRGGVEAAKSLGESAYEMQKEGEFSPLQAAQRFGRSYTKGFELGAAGRHPEGGLGQDVASSPSTTLGIATFPLTGGAGIFSTAAKAGLGGGITEAAGQYLQEGEVTPERVVGGISGGAAGGVGSKIIPTFNSTQAVKKIGEEITGSSGEALERASTQAGREALKQAAGNEVKIAQKLVDDIDNWENYAPEFNGVIKPALDKMGDINIAPALGKLQSIIENLKAESRLDPTGIDMKTANILEQYMDNFRGGQQGFPKTKFSANDVYLIRKKLDRNLDFSQIPEGADVGEGVNKALKEVRTELKNALLQKADKSGMPQYREAMQTLSKKLDAKDRFDGKVGKNKNTRLDRTMGLIRGVESNARPSQGQLLADIDEIFGKDYAQQAKDALYARDISAPSTRKYTGEPAYYPVQSTGRSGVGGAVEKVSGWTYGPRAFSQAYIPMARGFEAVSTRTGMGETIKQTSPLLRPLMSTFGGKTLDGKR